VPGRRLRRTRRGSCCRSIDERTPEDGVSGRARRIARQRWAAAIKPVRALACVTNETGQDRRAMVSAACKATVIASLHAAHQRMSGHPGEHDGERRFRASASPARSGRRRTRFFSYGELQPRYQRRSTWRSSRARKSASRGRIREIDPGALLLGLYGRVGRIEYDGQDLATSTPGRFRRPARPRHPHPPVRVLCPGEHRP